LAGNTCPLGKETRDQRSDVRFPDFPISAFAFASQLWSKDFTAKLFCNVEFWTERLAKLIKPNDSTTHRNPKFRARLSLKASV
jgi:hypothetical protein